MESKKYWKGLEELNNDPAFIAERDKEFKDELPVEEIFNSSIVNQPTGRRDFLRMLGFGLSAATLAASCRIPIKKAIPYVIKPEEVTPGVANWYASSFINGNDFCPVLVKVRDGRPIKLEPLTTRHISDTSPYRFFFGGTSARAQASVLSLYDLSRPRNWTVGGKKVSAQDQNSVDGEIKNHLGEIKAANGGIAIVTSTILSPSTKQVIADFKAAYPTATHVVYDAISHEGIASAHEKMFGKRTIPGYHFENASVIVSVGADFLGTWISPTEYTRQYVQNRKVKKDKTKMSRHYQFESRISLTGSNADRRGIINPSEEGKAIIALYNKVAELKGAAKLGDASLKNAKSNKIIEDAANDLVKAGSASLVVCGSNDANVQMLVGALNNMLGAYGKTIDLNRSSNAYLGNASAMQSLVDGMNSSAVQGVIVYGCNPVYDHPGGKAFADALKKTKLSVSLNEKADETTEACNYHVPDHHYLESWNDAEPRTGLFTLAQPTIHSLFETRQAQESLLRWAGSTDDFYTYIKKYWQANVYGRQTLYGDFVSFWDNCVKEGAIEVSMNESASASSSAVDWEPVVAAVTSATSSGLELELYEKVALGDGRYANNPWLHEMPDPVSRVVWENYLMVSPKFARDNNLMVNTADANVWADQVNVKAGNFSVDVPVVILPGQNDNAVALALGYGRTKAGFAGNGVGQNASGFVTMADGIPQYNLSGVTVTKLNKQYDIAMTQTHYSYEGRDAIQEKSLVEYKKNPDEGKEEKEELKSLWAETLYPTQQFPGPRWAMSIDLNSCIGCGACTVSCMAENNVPVVGKSEVRRVHEMSWIRIDRYFSFPSDSGMLTKETDIKPDDIGSSKVQDFQDVRVTFQPMLCQHCTNAPCENVCPVNATNHSSEGLNQMAYNRCIGTRYCANNCPYKVRRFNWLDYTTADVFPWNEPWKIPTLHAADLGLEDPLTRMVLNPDVTVRSRGVMEKCSFCVQRIQAGKLEAKKQSRPIMEGDIKTACQTACPADAIQFGNINDEKSRVAEDHDDARGYYVLAELNTRPAIAYMKKVRNEEGELETV